LRERESSFFFFFLFWVTKGRAELGLVLNLFVRTLRGEVVGGVGDQQQEPVSPRSEEIPPIHR
jgi:hypothetical protein